MRKHTLCTLGLITALLLAFPVAAEDEEQWWPHVMEGKTATVTMYQPQLETWKDGIFESRAAVSVKEGDGAPVFGAVWISGRFEVDRDTRMVHLSDITVPSVAFPEASEEDQQELAAFLEREIPKWDLSVSLDRVLPMLETAELDQRDGRRQL